jgi:hypothetical protein
MRDLGSFWFTYSSRHAVAQPAPVALILTPPRVGDLGKRGGVGLLGFQDAGFR